MVLSYISKIAGSDAKIRGLSAKEFYISIILTMFLTDIVILLDIPGFRDFLAFLYFTIIPGLLVLQIFRLNQLEFLKKFVLSVGLSLFVIMAVGLLLNSLYPLILKPLSLMPLLISFNVSTTALTLIAYHRNKNDFDITDIFNFKIDVKNKLASPMVLSILFPFMAIIGTYLMNTTGNNFILLAMLLMIPLYIVVLIYLKDKVTSSVYPFAIWMISLSILLMTGLTSSYPTGRDVHLEFYCFQLTLNNFHWDFLSFSNTYNTCLSVTILPTIYNVLTSLSAEYVFKLIFALIGSVIPLVIYIISRKYLENKYALMATFLFMSQMFFIEILGVSKQVFSFLFFFLAVFVLFESDMGKSTKKVLFVILMLSVVLSHYTTAFVGYLIVVPILLIPFLKNLLSERKIKLVNFDVIAVLGISSFLWYILIAKNQISTASFVLARASGSLTGVETTRESTVLAVLGIGLKTIPGIISAIVNDAIFLTIGIGLISVLIGYRLYNDKIDFEFIVGGIMATILLVLFVIIPSISNDYGASRLFLQSLAFLAPIFVIGGIKIATIIKKPKLNVLIILILLISLFACSTHLQYQLYGIPSSSYYDADGFPREETYIYNQDISAVKFLGNYREKDFRIYTDAAAPDRLLAANDFNILNQTFYFPPENATKGDYIYLTYVNNNKNVIFISIAPSYVVKNTTDYKEVFNNRNLIYNNGGSKIWEY